MRSFVREAGGLPGVVRIALVGSLTMAKVVPKDADVLVTIDPDMDLETLARTGRRLKGRAQTINLGADIFLADKDGRYLGRICHYRECFPRVLCRALHCGVRRHLNDDLDVVKLPSDLVCSPPLELWPSVVALCAAIGRRDVVAEPGVGAAEPGPKPTSPQELPRSTANFRID